MKLFKNVVLVGLLMTPLISGSARADVFDCANRDAEIARLDAAIASLTDAIAVAQEEEQGSRQILEAMQDRIISLQRLIATVQEIRDRFPVGSPEYRAHQNDVDGYGVTMGQVQLDLEAQEAAHARKVDYLNNLYRARAALIAERFNLGRMLCINDTLINPEEVAS